MRPCILTDLVTADDYVVGSTVRTLVSYPGWFQRETDPEWPGRSHNLIGTVLRADNGTVCIRYMDGTVCSWNPIPASDWLVAETVSKDGNPGLTARRLQRRSLRPRRYQ